MRFPIDTNKTWYFTYSDNLLPTEIPVEINKDKKLEKLTIEIPWGVKGMTIEITDYNKATKELKGTYTIKDLNSTDQLIFKIQEKGRLQGIPQGFHGKKVWILQQRKQ